MRFNLWYCISGTFTFGTFAYNEYVVIAYGLSNMTAINLALAMFCAVLLIILLSLKPN